jgi:hypothetical protein
MKVIRNYLVILIFFIAYSKGAISYWDKIQTEVAKSHFPQEEKKGEGMIVILGSEFASLKNFKIINDIITKLEHSYIECIEDITDINFSETTINKCIGKDYRYFLNDVKYEEKKVISRVASTLEQLIFEACYREAGMDQRIALSCDLIQTDINDLLWSGLNFYDPIRISKLKYTKLFGDMPEEIFDNIVNDLRLMYEELEHLKVEMIDHRDISLIKIKVIIDRKTKNILLRAKDNIFAPQPKLFTNEVEVEEWDNPYDNKKSI